MCNNRKIALKKLNEISKKKLKFQKWKRQRELIGSRRRKSFGRIHPKAKERFIDTFDITDRQAKTYINGNIPEQRNGRKKNFRI
jgi:hypothetical protein